MEGFPGRRTEFEIRAQRVGIFLLNTMLQKPYQNGRSPEVERKRAERERSKPSVPTSQFRGSRPNRAVPWRFSPASACGERSTG